MQIMAEILFERDSYFQRKHKDKYKFPLVISTILRYFQRKHKEKHIFPLVIEFFCYICSGNLIKEWPYDYWTRKRTT